MLFILLLPLLVTAEWVEISQNHYRKETNHKHSNIHQEIASKYNTHNNRSIVNQQWSKGYVQRVPGTNIKRLQESGSELQVIGERNTFRRHELSSQKPVLRTEITQWKSGNALIERLDHRHIPYSQHTTATSKNRPPELKNNEELIETVTSNSRQNSHMIKNELTKELGPEKRFKSTLNYSEENNDGMFSKIIHKNQTISGTSNNFFFNQNEFHKSDNNPEQTATSKRKEKTKTDAIETLMKFLKVVSQTINQSTQRSFNSKVRYLQGLKESLLGSIEERINSAFPDDNNEQPRHRRATGPDIHGHVDFPSSESALMTISFLTFAVFLIKLVLQVIHTYKAKTMMVTPAVVATVGRAAAVLKKSTRN